MILALSADAPTLLSTVIIKDLAPDVPVIAQVNRAENVERIYAADADFALSTVKYRGNCSPGGCLAKNRYQWIPSCGS